MRNLAFWGIFVIPILWGAGFPLTHNAVRLVNPGYFAFCRIVIAAICLFPFALKYFSQINKKVIIGGCLVGFWSTLNMVAQSFALSTISSAMTAFFVTLNILFVPFLLFAFRLSRLKIVDIFAVILGLISIFITFHGSLTALKMGDWYGLLAAFSIAMNIVTIQIVTKNQATNKLLLAFFSMLFGILFLSYFPATSHDNMLSSPTIWGALLYQGAISTALAYLLQMTFQKNVGETRTAIILNLDLVFASLFGLINSEMLTGYQIAGGIVALFASLFHDVFDSVKNKFSALSSNFSKPIPAALEKNSFEKKNKVS